MIVRHHSSDDQSKTVTIDRNPESQTISITQTSRWSASASESHSMVLSFAEMDALCRWWEDKPVTPERHRAGADSDPAFVSRERVPAAAHVIEHRFPLSDPTDAQHQIWATLEWSGSGVHVTFFRDDPGGEPLRSTTGLAGLTFEFYENRVQVRLYDSQMGPDGDQHWVTPGPHGRSYTESLVLASNVLLATPDDASGDTSRQSEGTPNPNR